MKAFQKDVKKKIEVISGQYNRLLHILKLNMSKHFYFRGIIINVDNLKDWKQQLNVMAFMGNLDLK